MLGLVIAILVLAVLSMLLLSACAQHLHAIRKVVEAHQVPDYPPRH